MKSSYREFLTDLKAAVLIGHPEGVEIALEGLWEQPLVASNQRLSEAFIAEVLLPAGKLMASLPAQDLRPMLGDPSAAVRTIGAAALAWRFFSDADVTHEDLRRAAGDPRPEVRAGLGGALFATAQQDSTRLLSLGEKWCHEPSPRLRQTALNFLPALADSHADRLLALYASLGDEDDRKVRAALVAALVDLAGAGQAESILDLLASWASGSSPNIWVIAKTLSASWAAVHHVRALAILETIQSRTGKTKEVTNALRALERHGVGF
jgi:hypothetical protein